MNDIATRPTAPLPPAVRRSPGAGRRGITLLELLTVVAVIGLLTALALPMLTSDSADRLEAVAEGFASDLAYARGLAVMNDSRYSISWNSQTNSYTLRHTGANPTLHLLPSGPLGSPADPADERIMRLSEIPSMGTQLQILGGRLGAGTTATSVEFGPLGSTTAASPTTVWFAAGGGGQRRYISVVIHPVTGLASPGAVQAAPPTL